MLELVPLGLSAIALAAYLVGLGRLRRRGDRWPPARTACMVLGSACVAAALLPPLGARDDLFAVHVTQHLLVGMVGPALLALSAPVTLALRVAPAASRRRLLAVLHSRVVRLLTWPAVALVLDLGALYALYLTRAYRAMERSPLLHAGVHLHMFLAGCLLSWVLVGSDPVPRRSVAVKLVTLGLAGAAHDTLSKLMYAHGLPAGAGTLLQRHLGAEVMYYGGTVVELAVAVVVMSQWWRVTGRVLTHSARRSPAGPAPGPVASSPALGPHPRPAPQPGDR